MKSCVLALAATLLAGCSFALDWGGEEGRPCKESDCLAGYSCVDGACVSGTGGAGTKIGAACADDAACGGDERFCDRTVAGGYCTKSCADDGVCGGGAHCPEGGACVRACEARATCRTAEAYECVDGDLDGRAECLPLGRE